MRYLLLALTFGVTESLAGEYLVRFRESGGEQSLVSLSDELKGAEVEDVLPEQHVVLVKPGTSALPDADVLNMLRGRSDVALVQRNFRYRAALFIDRQRNDRAVAPHLLFETLGKPELKPVPEQTPGEDPRLGEDKDLELANAKGAWSLGTGSRQITVAVLDTGVDYNHEDLAANMWRHPNDASVVGWDFVDNDNRPYDVTAPINFFTGAGNPGHGTHCAGNVGAIGGNSTGTTGIAHHVSIMALRMLDHEGSGETSGAIQAIDYAIKHGARIISASWGGEGESEDDALLKEAIARAEAKGVLFLAAAGNTQPKDQKDADNDTSIERRTYPASFDLPNIISVAASNQKGAMAEFTHFGAKTVDLAAPGEQSFSTVPGNGYEDQVSVPFFGKLPWNGTSMASPHVAGAAALLLAKYPDWSYAQLKKRLMETTRAEPTFQGKSVTGGVLDVARALKD